jgi:hypothetical protein
MPGGVGNCYLSLPLGWESCFLSLALFSRHIRQRLLHNPIPPLRGERWRQCFTSTSASTRWVGARCRGYTHLISFRHGPDTMEWPSHLHHSGCGVSIFHESYIYELMTVFADFVVSKVTPTIHTRLGYKMFLMFATLNVGAMAPFSLCHISNHFARNEHYTHCLAVLSQKRKDAHSKKWISYSVPLVRLTALRILCGMNKARFFLKIPCKLLSLSKTTEIANVAHADLERAGSIDEKGDEN